MRDKFLRAFFVFACTIGLPARVLGDDRVAELLRKVEAATKAVDTLRADVTMTWAPLPGNKDLTFAKPGASFERHWTGNVHFRRPNLARIETIQSESDKKEIQLSDGRNHWQWDSVSDECYKYSLDPHDPNIILARGWPSFFNSDFSGLIADNEGTTKYTRN